MKKKSKVSGLRSKQSRQSEVSWDDITEIKDERWEVTERPAAVNTEEKTFSTGAKRSKDADGYCFTLLHPDALFRLAAVARVGATKYGEYNWEKGMPARECIEHALQHILHFLNGYRGEDHLAHAMWNLHSAMVSCNRWPHLNRDLRSWGGALPSDIQQQMAIAQQLAAAAAVSDTSDTHHNQGFLDKCHEDKEASPSRKPLAKRKSTSVRRSRSGSKS